MMSMSITELIICVLLATFAMITGASLSNPIEEDKIEQKMKQENMLALGYINDTSINEEYYVELPEEINQANIGDLLEVMSISNGIITLGFHNTHTCIDPTHAKCDGQCECDGLACATATNK